MSLFSFLAFLSRTRISLRILSVSIKREGSMDQIFSKYSVFSCTNEEIQCLDVCSKMYANIYK